MLRLRYCGDHKLPNSGCRLTTMSLPVPKLSKWKLKIETRCFSSSLLWLHSCYSFSRNQHLLGHERLLGFPEGSAVRPLLVRRRQPAVRSFETLASQPESACLVEHRLSVGREYLRRYGSLRKSVPHYTRW